MTKDDPGMSTLEILPTEVLLFIFTYLPAQQLTRCRQVCLRWKQIVDGLARSDTMWREYCKCDYSNVCITARRQCRPGLLWYDLYRSITLWPKLLQARETRDEFAAASGVNEEIRDFQILRDGVIGVHKRKAVVFYDIDTLQRSKRRPVNGEYLRYTENDDTLVILGYHLHLYIIRKALKNPCLESNVTFDNVKTFILVDQSVYYVNLGEEIFECKLDNPNLSTTLLCRVDEGIMTLGYSDCLNILTFQRNIFSYQNNVLTFNCALGQSTNLLHQLKKFNFLEHLDWRIYFQWMYVLNHSIPEGPLRDIITVRAYGDIYFVGSNWGVLRIYYAPYTEGEFDLFNAEPIKQFNFMERYDCPVLSMCPILQVDVLEAEDGHTVLVAMPKKIAILNFVHSFKRTASVALLAYEDIQKVKVLKIEDNT